MNGGKWWSSRRVLSYGTDIAIVEGGRDIGKSYGQLIRAIKNTIRRGASMAWLRRTEVEADALARSVGSGKWKEVLRRFGLTKDDVKRKGNIVYIQTRGEWRRCIRYAALSQWNSLRDTDTPEERYIFLDEAFTTMEKRRLYEGSEVRDFLDIYKSLRRGKEHFQALICGNADAASNVYLEYFALRPTIGDEGVELLHAGDARRIAFERVKGRDAGSFSRLVEGTAYGAFMQGTPHGVNNALISRGVKRGAVYGAFDLFGYVSIWYTREGFMLVDTANTGGLYYVGAPNGDRAALVFDNSARRRLGVLREAWRVGRVRFASPLAYERGMRTLSKVL